MVLLSIAVSIAFLIFLLMRIGQMTGGHRVVINTTMHGSQADDLPRRTAQEVQTMLANAPTRWCAYQGSTPPLELLIRGVSEELFRRFARAHQQTFGPEYFSRMSREELTQWGKENSHVIKASAYVLDWKGAQYPNGNPMPYTADNLAFMLRRDELLGSFISDEAQKLCPWDAD